jgi:hypothetical protein
MVISPSGPSMTCRPGARSARPALTRCCDVDSSAAKSSTRAPPRRNRSYTASRRVSMCAHRRLGVRMTSDATGDGASGAWSPFQPSRRNTHNRSLGPGVVLTAARRASAVAGHVTRGDARPRPKPAKNVRHGHTRHGKARSPWLELVDSAHGRRSRSYPKIALCRIGAMYRRGGSR